MATSRHDSPAVDSYRHSSSSYHKRSRSPSRDRSHASDRGRDDKRSRSSRSNSHERSYRSSTHYSSSSRHYRDDSSRSESRERRSYDRDNHKHDYNSTSTTTTTGDKPIDKSKHQSSKQDQEEDEQQYLERIKKQEALMQEEEEDDETRRRKARERRMAIMQKYQQGKATAAAAAPQNDTTSQVLANTTAQLVPASTPSTSTTTAEPTPAPAATITTSVPDTATKDTTATTTSAPATTAPETSSTLTTAVDNSKSGVKQQQTVSADNVTSSTKSPVFDMFSDSPDDELANVPTLQKATTSLQPSSSTTISSQAGAVGPTLDSRLTATLTDNWNDADGYYLFTIGEVMNGRYKIISSFGKGVFSTVLKAIDLDTPRVDQQEVAIKVIRNNDMMRKAGLREVEFLRKLNDLDKEDKRHCIRCYGHFEYRNHLCIVFEPLYMNLREVLRKFGKEQGREVGLSIEAVRLYAKQLFIALKHLMRAQIFHADIKPDNILMNERKNVIKLADFGSASDASETGIAPYLVSRFYRAPEIMLGHKYDYALDVWSVGTTLYELYTGEIMFPGKNNNDMLRLIMEYRGKFSNKFLRKCQFASDHFDADFNFLFKEKDTITGKEMIRKMQFANPTRDLQAKLLSVMTVEESSASYAETRRRVLQLKDLLDKCLTLDPAKRITPDKALLHPFFQKQ